MNIDATDLRIELTKLVQENKDWQITASRIEKTAHAKKIEIGATSTDCFMYVFGKNVERCQTLSELLSQFGSNVHNRKEENDDVIFYFNGDDIIHVGNINSQEEVISKWGQGPVFAHKIENVPASYGNTVLFMEKSIYLLRKKPK